MAFGLVSGIQLVCFNSMVASCLGRCNVTIVSAVMTGTSALLAIPMGIFSDRHGRTPFMLMGCLAHAAFCVLLLTTGGIAGSEVAQDSSSSTAGKHWFWLLCAAVLLGVGNSVWSLMNASIFGDLFSHAKEPAFALLKFWSGLPTGVVFFIAPSHGLPTRLIAIATLAVLFVGFAGFRKASRLFSAAQVQLP